MTLGKRGIEQILDELRAHALLLDNDKVSKATSVIDTNSNVFYVEDLFLSYWEIEHGADVGFVGVPIAAGCFNPKKVHELGLPQYDPLIQIAEGAYAGMLVSEPVAELLDYGWFEYTPGKDFGLIDRAHMGQRYEEAKTIDNFRKSDEYGLWQLRTEFAKAKVNGNHTKQFDTDAIEID